MRVFYYSGTIIKSNRKATKYTNYVYLYPVNITKSEKFRTIATLAK